MSDTGPIILSAHRSLIVAEGTDGLRYEVSRDPSTHPEAEANTAERQISLSFTPEEARRVSTYMISIGWRRVRVVSVPLTDLRAGKRPLMIDNVEAVKRTIRFAAAGSIACAAVTNGEPEDK